MLRSHDSLQDTLLSGQVLPDDVSNLPVPLHTFLDERLLVRPEVTNQSLGDVIAVDLVTQLLSQHAPLLTHLVDLPLRANKDRIKQVFCPLTGSHHEFLPSLRVR